jgi:DNA-binding HxlR family transcriptional regulator
MNDDVYDALDTLTELLPGWAGYDRERAAKEITRLEKAQQQLQWLERLDQTAAGNEWVAGHLAEQGGKCDPARLDNLRAERAQHTETTAKLVEAERVVCRFARANGIDPDPLKRLVEQGDAEQLGEARLALSHVLDALDALNGSAKDDTAAPQRTPVPNSVSQAVTKSAALILCVLLKHYPTLLTVEEIDGKLNGKLSGRTISPALKKLVDDGLAQRPSPRGGATLTAAGKELAEKLPDDA